MDAITIVAFVIGIVIAGIIFYIKDQKLIKADQMASMVIAYLRKALTTYGDAIKEYDKENGTTYFATLSKTLEDITLMEEDETITPLEFAVNVVKLYDDIQNILKNVNLYDKIVTVEIEQ